MHVDEFRKLIKNDENAKLEFKREWYKKEEFKSELIKDIFALSNGDIYTINKTAYLIIGIIDDTKKVYDFDKSSIPKLDKLKQQLLQNLNNYAQPEFLGLVLEYIDINDCTVLIISILPRNKLISLSKDLQLKNNTDKKGTTYYRVGEDIKVASPDVIEDYNQAFKKNKKSNSTPIIKYIPGFSLLGFSLIVVVGIYHNNKNEIIFNEPIIKKFPIHVTKHYNVGLVGFGKGECPLPPYKAGNNIVLKMFINSNVPLNKLTPAIIKMNKVYKSNNQSQIFSQQFKLNRGVNNFLITTPTSKGNYILESGFFIKDELNTKIPTFHAIKCPIKVEL